MDKKLSILFSLSIAACALNLYTIYPALFLSFSILSIIRNGRGAFNSNSVSAPLTLIIIFLTIFTLTYIANIDSSSSTQFFKGVINLTFLATLIIAINKRLPSDKSIRIIIAAFIISMSAMFIELAYVVHTKNLWLTPFTGISNSIEAYNAFDNYEFIFGNSNKNIYATKFLIFYMSYMCLLILTGKRHKTSLLSLFMVCFCQLYLLSRTGQVALILLLSLTFIINGSLTNPKNKSRFNYFRAMIPISFIAFIAAFYGEHIYSSIIRIDYSELYRISADTEGDGLKARIYMWSTLFKNIQDFNMVFGNGIFSWDYLGQTREGNLHNVFLNTWFDLGIIALLIYFLIIYYYPYRNNFSYTKIPLIVLFLISNSHYLGYDNDIIIIISVIFIAKAFKAANKIDTTPHPPSVRNASF